MVNPTLEHRIREELALGRLELAVNEGLRGYGPRIAGYVRTLIADREAAEDVFGQFCERLWKAIPRFRVESSFLTWAYGIAWHTVQHHFDSPYERRRQRLDTDALHNLAHEIYSSTGTGETSALMGTIERLRQTLTPLEQSLLTLRVEQGLSWKEVAEILAEHDAPVEEAALRKRYERLRARIRKELAQRGVTRTVS